MNVRDLNLWSLYTQYPELDRIIVHPALSAKIFASLNYDPSTAKTVGGVEITASNKLTDGEIAIFKGKQLLGVKRLESDAKSYRVH